MVYVCYVQSIQQKCSKHLPLPHHHHHYQVAQKGVFHGSLAQPSFPSFPDFPGCRRPDQGLLGYLQAPRNSANLALALPIAFLVITSRSYLGLGKSVYTEERHSICGGLLTSSLTEKTRPFFHNIDEGICAVCYFWHPVFMNFRSWIFLLCARRNVFISLPQREC